MSDTSGSRAERAFLVQLDQLERGAGNEAVGRVEHVRSGEASRFGSVGELIAFMGRVLDARDSEDRGAPDA